MKTFYPKSEKEMLALGAEIAKTLKGGDVVTLTGELGAGKTTLTKGILQALGVSATITSPTFTILNEYTTDAQGIKRIAHVDTYRLESEKDLINIGIEEYLNNPTTLTIIEWPEKLNNLLKSKKVVAIRIDHTSDGRMVVVA